MQIGRSIGATIARKIGEFTGPTKSAKNELAMSLATGNPDNIRLDAHKSFNTFTAKRAKHIDRAESGSFRQMLQSSYSQGRAQSAMTRSFNQGIQDDIRNLHVGNSEYASGFRQGEGPGYQSW